MNESNYTVVIFSKFYVPRFVFVINVINVFDFFMRKCTTEFLDLYCTSSHYKSMFQTSLKVEAEANKNETVKKRYIFFFEALLL